MDAKLAPVRSLADIPADRSGDSPLPSSGTRTPRPSDVWSRTRRRDRRRAIVLLILNFLLFCGLCVFLNWLHFAQAFDFSWRSYAEPLRFWGPQVQTLNDFVHYPINVVERPIHAVVLGLVMAALVAVPISVAILYGFAFALPFVAAVFVLGHLPWMAICLVLSCILAGARPFQLRFRYGAALVGLVPVVIYIYFAARGDASGSRAIASPEEQQMLIAPWVLAILGAAAMLALILGLARLVNYRPDVVPPVIAMAFATPLVLFHRWVGADELAYRVLEHDIGPGSAAFESSQDAKAGIRALLHNWTQRDAEDFDPDGSTLVQLWSGDAAARAALKQQIAARFQCRLLELRRDAYEACKKFIADYPTSRYGPAVLYLQGRSMDTRLAEGPLLGDPPTRELYTSFPHVQSRTIWDRVLTQAPTLPYGIVAALRGAQLRLREGDVAGALERLDFVLKRDADLRDGLATPPPTNIGTRLETSSYIDEACRLAMLIRANNRDPRYGLAPLTRFAKLDRQRVGYRQQLARLLAEYPDSLMADNLALQWALEEAAPDTRARLVKACLQNFPEGDARDEATYRLAELEILREGRDDAAARERGLQRLRDLAANRRGTCWARRATDLLTRLAPTTAPASTPTGPR